MERITESFVLLGENDRVNNNLSGKQLNHISACKWRKNHMASSKTFQEFL